MLNKILLAVLAPLALLAACYDNPTVVPEVMPVRAWAGEPVDVFERSKVLVEGQDPTVMQIEVFEVGTGPEAQKGDTVSVHYTGWVKGNEVEFDSSHNRGAPYSLKLGAGTVIPGWTLGLEGMRQGTRARFRIPSPLGYGAGGNGPIPPDAPLVFDVELVDIRPAR